MLICPPFLPSRTGIANDPDWLDIAMRETPPDGSYPLGNNFCWHGGVHLEAPMENGDPLPVRAIADGTIIVRVDPQTKTGGGHPLNYDPDGQSWTSNGLLIIEHNTEIGANYTTPPVAVAVRFYSVYQHLDEIETALTVGSTIYRKTKIGKAGSIAGRANRIHFEIACNDENLERLIGRRTGELNTTRNGRTDVLFGDIYIRLPAGTPLYTLPSSRRMRCNGHTPESVTITGSNAQPVPNTAITYTNEDLYIGLNYAQGEGVQANRGDLYITTYRSNGETCGTRTEQEAEYHIYTKRGGTGAVAQIKADLPTSAANSLVASAAYELMRFGRVVNTVLHPGMDLADIPHWRKIAYQQVGAANPSVFWVDLNNRNGAQCVTVFSDADFPQWRGWQIIDSDTDGNSRCDDNYLQHLCNTCTSGTEITIERILAVLQQSEMLRHAVCTMPTEWDRESVERRWRWITELKYGYYVVLKGNIPDNSPLLEDDFIGLCNFIKALCPPTLPAGFKNAQRHFHPRAFIETFRKNLWFKAEELAQLIPRRYPLNHTATTNSAQATDWATAHSRAREHSVYLNRMTQKYYGRSIYRAIHNLSQCWQETEYLHYIEELGFGSGKNYGPFYGRGYHQITWPDNYIKYKEYRNLPNHPTTSQYTEKLTTALIPRIRHNPPTMHPKDSSMVLIQWSPRYDPTIVCDNRNEATESSGLYWITKDYNGMRNINKACDVGESSAVSAYITYLVNGSGGDKQFRRLAYAEHIKNIIGDAPYVNESNQTAVIAYPPLDQEAAANNPLGLPQVLSQRLALHNGYATNFANAQNLRSVRVFYDFQRP